MAETTASDREEFWTGEASTPKATQLHQIFVDCPEYLQRKDDFFIEFIPSFCKYAPTLEGYQCDGRGENVSDFPAGPT